MQCLDAGDPKKEQVFETARKVRMREGVSGFCDFTHIASHTPQAAEKAIDLKPTDSNYWNTLGVIAALDGKIFFKERWLYE